jgi:hypothetical protein
LIYVSNGNLGVNALWQSWLNCVLAVETGQPFSTNPAEIIPPTLSTSHQSCCPEPRVEITKLPCTRDEIKEHLNPKLSS